MKAAIDTWPPGLAGASPALTGEAAPFASWPGPVVEVRPDGTTIQCNAFGRDLIAALSPDEFDGLRNLISLAFEAHGSVSDRLEVAGDECALSYECVILPVDEARALVLMRDETYNLNVRQALFESRQRYRDLVVISSDFAWETDADGVFVFVSPHGAMGYSAEDLVGHKPIEFVLDKEVNVSELPFSTRTPVTNAQIWMRDGSDEPACLVAAAVPVVDQQGVWCGARGLCRDVTDERIRDSALAQAKVREQVVAYIVNQMREQAKPKAMLEAAVAMLGRAESAAAAVYLRTKSGDYELAATHDDWPDDLVVASVLPPEADVTEPFRSFAAGLNTMASITQYRGIANGVVVLARKAHQKSWSGDDEAMLAAVSGQLAIALRQISDQRELERISSTDALTGLMNRRAFQQALDIAIARVRRNNTPGALLYVDLDNFKAINDNYGHETGDTVLREVAQILRTHSRTYDLVCRMGGDEFVVWLDGASLEAATRRARELTDALTVLARYSADGMPRLGASVGVVAFDPERDAETQSLLSRADSAMYEVKARNKQGVDSSDVISRGRPAVRAAPGEAAS